MKIVHCFTHWKQQKW